jgi:hypothetical protein
MQPRFQTLELLEFLLAQYLPEYPGWSLPGVILLLPGLHWDL